MILSHYNQPIAIQIPHIKHLIHTYMYKSLYTAYNIYTYYLSLYQTHIIMIWYISWVMMYINMTMLQHLDEWHTFSAIWISEALEGRKSWLPPMLISGVTDVLAVAKTSQLPGQFGGETSFVRCFRVGKLWRLQAGYDMVWWHINITIIRNLLNTSHTQYGWNVTSQKFPNPLSPPKSVSLGSPWAHGCGSFFMCRARGCCFAHHLGSSTRWVKPKRACHFLRCWGFEHECYDFLEQLGPTFWSKFLDVWHFRWPARIQASLVVRSALILPLQWLKAWKISV